MPDADELVKAGASAPVKALCYKTVDVFAGICGRKLWLKNGGFPRTDGYMIEVPFDHPWTYQYTEHEISHILFQSSAVARELFITEYAKKIGTVATKAQVEVDQRSLRRVLLTLAVILDDERVISLWGRLYKGSEMIMRYMKHKEAEDLKPHESLMQLTAYLAAGWEPGPGPLGRYQPYIAEALKRVRGVDYAGMLVVMKWLVVQLVSEIIRASRDEPPGLPSSWAGNAPGEDQSQMGTGGAGGPQDESEDDGPPAMPWEQSGAQGGAERPTVTPGTPEAPASVEERSRALRDLIVAAGECPADIEELQESKFKRAGEEQSAARQAQKALNAPVKDEQALDQALQNANSVMDSVVEKARHATRNALNHDDRLRKDAYAKVVFVDVEPSPHRDPHLKLSARDEETVRRLRALFVRVMGRRTTMLEEAGNAINIPAYLERRLSGEPLPVFQVDRSGRGFRTLVLVDRSSSMEGRRTRRAERACSIISRALDFPFVTRLVWGFQAWDRGQVDITRFRPGHEVFDSDSARVGGITPLHTAIRVALQELEDSTDTKHLFVLSDGFPVFARKDGPAYGTHTLMGFVRANVMSARTKGIGVTGVMIGGDIGAKGMRYMFGPSKYWRTMGEDTFGDDLVQLVSGAFVEYLRTQ